jgi:hypothetical protein
MAFSFDLIPFNICALNLSSGPHARLTNWLVRCQAPPAASARKPATRATGGLAAARKARNSSKELSPRRPRRASAAKVPRGQRLPVRAPRQERATRGSSKRKALREEGEQEEAGPEEGEQEEAGPDSRKRAPPRGEEEEDQAADRGQKRSRRVSVRPQFWKLTTADRQPHDLHVSLGLGSNPLLMQIPNTHACSLRPSNCHVT